MKLEKHNTPGSQYFLFNEIVSSLEVLGWDERNFLKASILLSKLIEIKQFSDVGNEFRALSAMFLPWYPQTLASQEKRLKSMRIIVKKSPEVGWMLLISLLPNRQNSTSSIKKPKWNNIDLIERIPRISNEDYLVQVRAYSNLLLDLAGKNISKISELFDVLDGLSRSVIDRISLTLRELLDDGMNDDDRQILWEKLTLFITKHHKYSGAIWALDNSYLEKISEIAELIKPKSIFVFYRHYFNARDFELFNEIDDWETQRKDLDEIRVGAISKIYSDGGVEAVISFSKSVIYPYEVGFAFGFISTFEVDEYLLPLIYDESDKKLRNFIKGYVWRRHLILGWDWVDRLNIGNWSDHSKASFLSDLPAQIEVWNRIPILLTEFESMYWANPNFVPSQVDENLEVAIKKLIQYDATGSAIDCLMRLLYAKQSPNFDLCLSALKKSLEFPRRTGGLDVYNVAELLKYLQQSKYVSMESLCEIEWGYLDILDGYHGATPIALHNKLSNSPEFFQKNISLIYKSSNSVADKVEFTEEERMEANFAWTLLHSWKTPPGMGLDGKFEEMKFLDWFNKTFELIEKSGHLNVGLNNIGQVLAYAPADSDGLWLNKNVAEILDDIRFEKAKNGYINGLFNKRGVYSVDPSGSEELSLSQDYEKKADDVENAGFINLASALRGLSDSYVREARSVIDEYKSD
ncbi:hypothetical protein [Polynucleobacter kasalickyi]|uniref:Uncharacterized protein n=1 Tax=Polynucleobacter kasalickyi TaxID=1938817 RepID=A0A1W2AJ94_9BURK|nr:hypothetical protein [Polynucleobacter kasalickyi]SMC60799.1 hypothetical protein SAMN06296008_1096 [Polynucleobacter kasalickyi]